MENRRGPPIWVHYDQALYSYLLNVNASIFGDFIGAAIIQYTANDSTVKTTGFTSVTIPTVLSLYFLHAIIICI